jgi:hypothetical protein
MRSVLALSLLIAPCASADAATVHHLRTRQHDKFGRSQGELTRTRLAAAVIFIGLVVALLPLLARNQEADMRRRQRAGFVAAVVGRKVEIEAAVGTRVLRVAEENETVDGAALSPA